MLEINGIPPKLSGYECEDMICQQYWYLGKLENEVDILFLKVNGKWHQLYFENGVIFWRIQNEAPTAFNEQQEDTFKYPLIDLGSQYGVKGCLIKDYTSEQLLNGARVQIEFEGDEVVTITNRENKTTIRYFPPTLSHPFQ